MSDLMACFPCPLKGSESIAGDLFDEYHALSLTNKHYGLTIASNDINLWRLTINNILAPAENNRAQFESKRSSLLSKTLNTFVGREFSPKSSIDNLVEIRKASIIDSNSVHVLLSSAFSTVSEKYSSVRKFLKNVKKQIHKDLDSEKFRMLVASAGNQVIGCAGIRLRLNDNIVELQHTAVDERFRKQGDN